MDSWYWYLAYPLLLVVVIEVCVLIGKLVERIKTNRRIVKAVKRGDYLSRYQVNQAKRRDESS
jgi:hypothetical protein